MSYSFHNWCLDEFTMIRQMGRKTWLNRFGICCLSHVGSVKPPTVLSILLTKVNIPILIIFNGGRVCKHESRPLIE